MQPTVVPGILNQGRVHKALSVPLHMLRDYMAEALGLVDSGDSPAPPPTSAGDTRTVRLDDSQWVAGIGTTVFPDLLPTEPELLNNVVVLVHSGVGPLKQVAGAPAAGEFQLSGTGNRTVTFGYAPDSGDHIHAIYVEASPPPAATKIVVLLDTLYNSATTTFPGHMPSEPDIATNEVVLVHSGVGALLRVAGAPAAGQFQLFGATNQDVEYGYPPDSGDHIHAIYVEA